MIFHTFCSREKFKPGLHVLYACLVRVVFLFSSSRPSTLRHFTLKLLFECLEKEQHRLVETAKYPVFSHIPFLSTVSYRFILLGILTRIKMPSNTPKYLETLSKDQLKEIWKTSDAVCFDVDSTVVEEEGIDELAEFCGVGEAVRQW